MTKAEQIMKLVLDQNVFAKFDCEKENGDERMGAFLLVAGLRRHFVRHISSSFGRTMFDSPNGEKRIAKILEKKVSYYCRNFMNEEEKAGAEKMMSYIKEDFTKIIIA